MPADIEYLQGNWQIEALEINGVALPATGSIAVKGNQFSATGMGGEYTGRVEISKPNRISLHFAAGPETGNTNHGLYEITESGWRLCLNLTGGPAPTTFTSANGHALETLVRAEFPPEPPVIDPATRQPIPELQGEWQMVSCRRSGEPLPGPFLKTGRRKIVGVHSTLHFGKQLFMQGLLSKDDGAPDAAKLEHTAGEFRGHAQLGIYQLNAQTLKTCFAAPGRPRPTGYASTPEGGETFTIWQRR